MVHSGAMLRVPLTLRALLLLPLLALGVDHARAALACGPGAESCLEASGHGWLGVTGVGLLLVFAAILAVGVARFVAGRAPGFLRLWGIGTAGVAAVCAGQALLAAALGDGAALGGGWLELAAFCFAAGGVLALTLRIAPAAAALVRDLRPSAPRLAVATAPDLAPPLQTVHVAAAPRTPATAERAPPRS